MISEEEQQKYVEATKCENCLQWHKHCNSECCRSIVLNVDLKELDAGVKYLAIKPKNKLGIDDIRYYRFHDVEYVRGLLRFKKERIVVVGRKVFYIHDYSRLDGNLCLDHPNKKPLLCQELNLETAKILKDRFELTNNCLFKYKCKEVKKDG